MNQKRNFIEEIKASVARSVLTSLTGERKTPEFKRLDNLINALIAAKDITDEALRDEIHRHIVVSLAAVVQVSARHTIAAIADAKETRGEDLPDPPNVRITFSMVRELKNRAFSTGRFIAHFFP